MRLDAQVPLFIMLGHIVALADFSKMLTLWLKIS